MNKDKRRIIEDIIDREGGYSDRPSDSGGKTMYGITETVARKYGYRGDMKNLPRGLAFDIYDEIYWASMCGDRIVTLSLRVVEELVDTAVNMGPHYAGEFLQETLNAFNKRGNLYPDIKVDGYIGPATVSALISYLKKRDEVVLVRALDCLQGARYLYLAGRYEKNEDSVYGWMSQRVGV